jgi:hypothetical protein
MEVCEGHVWEGEGKHGHGQLIVVEYVGEMNRRSIDDVLVMKVWSQKNM